MSNVIYGDKPEIGNYEQITSNVNGKPIIAWMLLNPVYGDEDYYAFAINKYLNEIKEVVETRSSEYKSRSDVIWQEAQVLKARGKVITENLIAWQACIYDIQENNPYPDMPEEIQAWKSIDDLTILEQLKNALTSWENQSTLEQKEALTEFQEQCTILGLDYNKVIS